MNQLSRFAASLLRLGAAGVGSPEFSLGSDGRDELRYIPFEYVNTAAKLVVVGITPGPKQLAMAYSVAQESLRAKKEPHEIQIACKRAAGFGGNSMRPNLLKMMRHFKFERILGIEDVAQLWSTHIDLLHTTSVVPHAAFRNGKPFAGSFGEVLASRLLRDCFEGCLVGSLRDMNPEARYVALGPTPREALSWMVSEGVLRADQVLGSFCHPSAASGSTTRYYLREVTRDELSARDPVRGRCEHLDQAYAEMKANTSGLHRAVSGAPASAPVNSAGEVTISHAIERSSRPAARADVDSELDGVAVIVKTIADAGYRLDNSKTKFAKFTAPNGEILYLVKKTSGLNKIVLGVHPRLDRAHLASLAGAASVSSRHMFHSNMRAFPRRRNNGDSETPYCWHVCADTLGSLERFLHAFAAVRLP